jgi:hypothetical protein
MAVKKTSSYVSKAFDRPQPRRSPGLAHLLSAATLQHRRRFAGAAVPRRHKAKHLLRQVASRRGDISDSGEGVSQKLEIDMLVGELQALPISGERLIKFSKFPCNDGGNADFTAQRSAIPKLTLPRDRFVSMNRGLISVPLGEQ